MTNGPFTSSGKNKPQNYFGGNKDSRNDLGYGKLDQKYQLPRQSGNNFPYVEPSEDVEDVEIDDETLAAVGKKSPNYGQSDFHSGASKDTFYFAGGNTKLSDCFWKTDDVINEVNTFANSLTPIPKLYKNMGPQLGNSGASFPYSGGGGSNSKRTGSTQGWSSKPPKSKIDAEDESDELDDIFTLKDIADKQMKKNGEKK